MYYSTSRNNNGNRRRLIRAIRDTGAFGYSAIDDTCKCYICGKKLYLEAVTSDEMAMECDHVIPISAFVKNPEDKIHVEMAYAQANMLKNLAPACKICNRFKSDIVNNDYVEKAYNSRYNK